MRRVTPASPAGPTAAAPTGQWLSNHTGGEAREKTGGPLPRQSTRVAAPDARSPRARTPRPRAGSRRRGANPAALALDHRGDPRQKVAQVVGQVGVVPGQHALVRELTVRPELLVAQEVVAVAVDTELFDEAG